MKGDSDVIIKTAPIFYRYITNNIAADMTQLLNG